MGGFGVVSPSFVVERKAFTAILGIVLLGRSGVTVFVWFREKTASDVYDLYIVAFLRFGSIVLGLNNTP